MKKKISPWGAIAQDDIRNSDVLIEKTLWDYTFQICVSNDSVWIVCLWPDSGQMAFRAAFGMGCGFETLKVIEKNDDITLLLVTRLGQYEVEVSFPDKEQPLFHYTTRFTPIPHC